MEIKLIHINQKIDPDSKWFYFGNSYENLSYLKKKLKIDNFLDFSIKKDEIFEFELNHYLDWTEKNRNKFNDSIYWWSTEFAGKNNLNSSFFRNICSLNFIINKIKEHKNENINIIFDDFYIKRAIENNLKLDGNKLFNFLSQFKKFFSTSLKLVLNIIKLLIKYLILKIVLLIKKNKLNFKDLKIIFNTAAVKITGQNLKLPYFPGLNLSQKNYIILYLSKKRLIEKINSISLYERNNIIIPERFVNPIELLLVIKNFLKVSLIFFKLLSYSRYDIKYLIYIELEKYLKIPDLNFQIWAFFPILKKLSKKCEINKVFDHYENMISEHNMTFAVKKYFKNSIIFGYHHTFSSNQFLCWRYLTKEWESDSKPDYIISSGILSKNFLISQNCPSKKIILGPALRYKDLISKKINNTNIIDNSVAIPLSQIKDHSLEVIEKVSEIHNANKNFIFYICPHPNLEIDNRIKKIFSYKDNGFILSKNSLRETITKCKFVISSATGAVYDSIILNKIVLNLRSDLNFCDNYTDFMKNEFNFLTTYNTEEISNILQKCSKDQIFFNELTEQFKKVSYYFVKNLQCDKDFFEITN